MNFGTIVFCALSHLVYALLIGQLSYVLGKICDLMTLLGCHSKLSQLVWNLDLTPTPYQRQ